MKKLIHFSSQFRGIGFLSIFSQPHQLFATFIFAYWETLPGIRCIDATSPALLIAHRETLPGSEALLSFTATLQNIVFPATSLCVAMSEGRTLRCTLKSAGNQWR